MRCSKCGFSMNVIDTRNDGKVTYRQYKCINKNCENRIYTKEQRIEDEIGKRMLYQLNMLSRYGGK